MLYDTYRNAPSNQWLVPASCWLATWSRAAKLSSRVNTAYKAMAVAMRIRNGVTAPISRITFCTSRHTTATTSTVTSMLPASAGMANCCSSKAPPPASITTVTANMKKVINRSTNKPKWRPQMAYTTSLCEAACKRLPSPARAMPRKVNNAALTSAPSRPQRPKSTKNSNSSRPEAKPAPTITPIKAPAIFSCSFISNPLVSMALPGPCCCFYPVLPC
ncbi:hypothetical protein D3C84_754860 [compost metagenome]